MLNWEKLLCATRRKDLYGPSESLDSGAGRTELERDYDRILFATPTRRLADKTQVFPMEQHDSIRTRLTHSHEVSNLARSIGVKIAFDFPNQIFGDGHEKLQVKRIVPPMLAAIGLAHDLGNPPFGHQGEVAIQQWFIRLKEDKSLDVTPDFLKFDGNAQSFRLLTRLQVLNDHYGLNLTMGTLGALMKYPSVYGSLNKGGFKKWGVFKNDEDIVKDVWEHTGLSEGIRHPFAYIMEACDDIAYAVIDAEDIVKKGYASFYDLMSYLKESSDDFIVKSVIDKSMSKHEEFKKENLSPRELSDISMQMFRVSAISKMILSVTENFVEVCPAMIGGSISVGYDLVKNSTCAALWSAVKKFDKEVGYNHRDVLRLELEGNNYIQNMLSYLWRAVSMQDNHDALPFERYVFGDISENYRRIYLSGKKSLNDQFQLMCDVLSGMTETYLIKKCKEYSALENVSAKV